MQTCKKSATHGNESVFTLYIESRLGVNEASKISYGSQCVSLSVCWRWVICHQGVDSRCHGTEFDQLPASLSAVHSLVLIAMRVLLGWVVYYLADWSTKRSNAVASFRSTRRVPLTWALLETRCQSAVRQLVLIRNSLAQIDHRPLRSAMWIIRTWMWTGQTLPRTATRVRSQMTD